MSRCMECAPLPVSDEATTAACDECRRAFDVVIAPDGVPRATRTLDGSRPLVMSRATLEAIRRNKKPETVQ